MKKTEIKLGAPKKEETSIKKNRCIRLSDSMIDLMKTETGLSLQEFVDLKFKELMTKRLNRAAEKKKARIASGQDKV